MGVGVFEGENIYLDLKLSWENNFTILGMEIDNKLKLLSKNFENVYNKTRSIISRWSGYDLSIQGKITVCKTLLISQYTYIGSILDCITSEQMSMIQTQMDFFTGLKLSWIRRYALEKINDHWCDILDSLCG